MLTVYFLFRKSLNNLSTKNVSRRTAGITDAKVHPTEPLFAVAERGKPPGIVVFTWPNLDIIANIR